MRGDTEEGSSPAGGDGTGIVGVDGQKLQRQVEVGINDAYRNRRVSRKLMVKFLNDVTSFFKSTSFTL